MSTIALERHKVEMEESDGINWGLLEYMQKAKPILCMLFCEGYKRHCGIKEIESWRKNNNKTKSKKG